MTPTEKDLAEFARLGLEYKLLGLPQIVAWGNEVVETRDDPPSWACELAMAGSEVAALAVFETMQWLRLCGDLTPLMPQRLVLALIKRHWISGKLQWEQVCWPLLDLIYEKNGGRCRGTPLVDVEEIRDLYGWIDWRVYENDRSVTNDEINAFLERIFATSESNMIPLPNWV